METNASVKVTSKAINVKFLSLDFECMEAYNNEGHNRVQMRVTPIADTSNNTNNNALAALVATYTSNNVYSIVLNFDGVKGATGEDITQDEITAAVMAAVKKSNGIMPATLVTVPVACVLDVPTVYLAENGMAISVRTLCFAGIGDYEQIAVAQVRNRLTRQLNKGELVRELAAPSNDAKQSLD